MSSLALKRKNVNMTEGKLLKNMVIFILPLMATNLLQLFYNIADTVIVSLSSNQEAVGAVGITGSLINVVITTVMGLAVGVNIVLARRIGAKDNEGVKRILHTGVLLMITLGVFFGGVGVISARFLLSLLGGREAFLDLASVYMRIYFLGVPFVALTNCGAAVLRAKGDSKTSLIILSISGLCNVLLNFLFVLVFDMAVAGVALATVISNVISTILIFIVLIRDKGVCHFSFKNLGMKKEEIVEILKVGLPIALQSIFISIADMMVASSLIRVNDLTSPPDAAYQPVIKGSVAHSSLEGFIGIATTSISQAAIAFMAQNYGAKKFDRMKKVINLEYLLMFVFSTVIIIIITLLRNPLLALYGVVDGPNGSLEHIAYQTAMQKIAVMWFPYGIIAAGTVGLDGLRALGHSTLASIIALSGVCVFRILWILIIFNANPTLVTLLLCYPVSSVLMAIAGRVAFGIKLDKKASKEKES